MLQDQEIECSALHQRMESGEKIALIDCRELWEYEVASLPGSHHLPLSEFAERSGELEQFRNAEIAVFCHHGVRSLQLTLWMSENGYPQTKSIHGGIDLWSQEIDESIPRY